MPALSRLLVLGLLPLALLAPLAACSDGDDGAAEAAPRVQRPEFSGDAALELLRKQVAFGPRVPGAPGHGQQLDWMVEYLRERADTVMVQSFQHTTSGGETLPLTNVFARFRPELKERVLLIAHWDTRPTADMAADPAQRGTPIPGANDGASGTAVLLQLAELFRKQPPPVGVDLLLVDGEDYGPGEQDMYLGAKHFAANQPEGYQPLYGVLVDMVGDKTPRFPVEGNSQRLAPEVVQRVYSVARDLGYGEAFPETPEYFISDDHIPLNEGGIRTIDIIDFEYPDRDNRFWHTPQDDVENTGPQGLEMVGEVLAELVYRGG